MTSGDVHGPTARPDAPPESTARGSFSRIDFRVANMGRSIDGRRGRDEPGSGPYSAEWSEPYTFFAALADAGTLNIRALGIDTVTFSK
jgi:hypothetical protein